MTIQDFTPGHVEGLAALFGRLPESDLTFIRRTSRRWPLPGGRPPRAGAGSTSTTPKALSAVGMADVLGEE